MAESTTFAQIGKIAAIAELFEGTPYKAWENSRFETDGKSRVVTSTRVFSEGLDFDLVYFPLRHLGHKCVTAVTGELCAQMAKARSLSVVLGLSAKLDFPQVQELWSGVVSAAKQYGYSRLSLDLQPSINGLSISISAAGECSMLTAKRRLAAHSKDLICVSGRLGAAYLGQQVLEHEKKGFDHNAESHPALERYRMQVGAYLHPELDTDIVARLEDAAIYPSYGYFINRGLSDALLRLSRDSGLGAKVYAGKLPFEGNSFQLGKDLDIDPISAAMNGGDDFQLLFVIPILSVEKFRKDFQTFDIIGHLALPDAGTTLVTPDGVELPISAQGW